jgi:hypothetical protein
LGKPGHRCGDINSAEASPYIINVRFTMFPEKVFMNIVNQHAVLGFNQVKHNPGTGTPVKFIDMRVSKIFFTLLLLSFIKIGLCQTQKVVASFNVANELNSDLLYMLDDHIKTIESDSNTAILKNGIHIFFIAPKFLHSDGIPDKIIDSLYSENDFPPSFDSPGYSVSILSVLDSSPAIRVIRNYPEKYEYDSMELKVVILSKLKLYLNAKGPSVKLNII